MTTTLQEAPPPVEEGQDETPTEPEFPQLALFEGHRITEFTVNFGGNVKIADEALIAALALDSEAELTISVRVVSRGHKVRRDEQGSVVATVSSSNLVVEGIALAE